VSKHPDNPAGRLLRIVNDLKQIEKNIIADAAWASVLGVDVSDTGSLLHGIGATLQLGQDTIEAIKKLNVNHDLYIGHVNQILRAFQKMHLGARIFDTMNNVKQEDIVGLSFCDERLSIEAPEKTLNENDLKKIHEDIMSLIDEVIEGDIDEYLRQYLLDKLDLLRQAVQLYNISGVKPIESAINDIFGSVVLNEKIKESADKPVTKKFVLIVMGLLTLISHFNDVVQLPESIDKVLPGSKQVACKIIEDQKAYSENIQEDKTAGADVKISEEQ
jgi:hypothetical protein